MARVQTTVTQTAEKIIKYRFICENCGHETDWMDGKITAAANSTYNGYVNKNALEMQENSNLKNKAHTNLAAAIRNNRESLKNGKPAGGQMFPILKCPKCQKKQSWAFAAGMTAKIVIFSCAIIGVGLTLLLRTFWPLLPCFIVLIAMAIIDTKRAVKYRRSIMDKGIKSLEIDWLDENLPVKY